MGVLNGIFPGREIEDLDPREADFDSYNEETGYDDADDEEVKKGGKKMKPDYRTLRGGADKTSEEEDVVKMPKPINTATAQTTAEPVKPVPTPKPAQTTPTPPSAPPATTEERLAKLEGIIDVLVQTVNGQEKALNSLTSAVSKLGLATSQKVTPNTGFSAKRAVLERYEVRKLEEEAERYDYRRGYNLNGEFKSKEQVAEFFGKSDPKIHGLMEGIGKFDPETGKFLDWSEELMLKLHEAYK